MTLQALNNLSTTGDLPFPAGALDKLAAHARAAGLCLLALRADGSISWHDAEAGQWYSRFVLPQLQDPQFADRARGVAPEPTAVVCDFALGVPVAIYPHLERRQVLGYVALAARGHGFRIGESVLRACGRLRLDSTWLSQQADLLPSYSRDALTRQADLLMAMLRDQLRLCGMEQELNSLSEQLANTYEELSLIYQISSGMKVNRRASDFFRQTCVDVLEVMNVRAMGVVLQGDGSAHPEPVLYGSLQLPGPVLNQLSAQILPLLRERKSPLLVNQLQADKSLFWLAAHAHRLLVVPLQRQEQVLGCLFALDKQGGEFDSVDTKLLNSIANESAIYLENSMLFGDVHGLMMGLLHSLTSAVDAKDAYTCGHSERVALLSRHLAIEIARPDAEVEQIYMAGLLHDVGKIGVPESVLQKTGRLTPEEFEQMKKHPQIGARILADVKQIKPIVPGVLHHHERYDGKGYPAGLAGNDIPLMGRIICLADCFDAMTSNRTYRKALPLEVALTEIRRCAGTQFDPTLAEAFLRTDADVFRDLLRNHAEKSKRLLELQQTLRTG